MSFSAALAFAERHSGQTAPFGRLREDPRAQRRALTEPLASFAHRYAERGEALARAFATGVDTILEVATFFGIYIVRR